MLKVSEFTPFSGLFMRELLLEAGLPADLYQIVTGFGPDIGPALIDAADFVGFTGSGRVGSIVGTRAVAQLKSFYLELGGKNPMIVLDDADLSRAVYGTARGCFGNSGHVCVSFERIYVQRGIYDRFVQAFVEFTQKMTLNNSFDYSADMGSLISQQQFEKVQAHVEDAVSKGATILAGGKARPDLGPYFYEPTILADVVPEMDVCQVETFGPVVSIYPVDSAEEAIDLANSGPYGLNAGIWTKNVKLGRAMAAQIRCGTVNINEGYAAAWGAISAPQGGMGASGIGRRHGAKGIQKFTEAQTVVSQHWLPLAPPLWLSTKVWVNAMRQVVRVIPHDTRLAIKKR